MNLNYRLQVELEQWKNRLRSRLAPIGDEIRLMADRARNTAKASYHLGQRHLQEGRYAEAKRRFRYCVWRNERHIEAWRGLAKCSAELEEWEDARAALDTILKLAPQDDAALFYRNTLNNGAYATGKDQPESLPLAVLREQFVPLVERYETLELSRKGYAGHMALEAVMAPLIPEGVAKPKILELGCGTGLCGSLIYPYAAHLIGLDVLPEMLESAKLSNTLSGERVVYDGFIEAEAVAYLSALPTPDYGVVVATNFLPWHGQLEALMRGVFRALHPGGYFLASGYYAPEGSLTGWQYLYDKHCFGHQGEYLKQCAESAGLTAFRLLPAPLYDDDSTDSFLMVLQKPAL